MTFVPYIACVLVAIGSLFRVLGACLENDGCGEKETHGHTGVLLMRLLCESAVLICVWRAWP